LSLASLASPAFDEFAASYKTHINRAATLSGESFDYFVRLRTNLLADRLSQTIDLHAPLRVLDFGCGIGETERHLTRVLPHCLVYGVDESGQSVRVAAGLGLTNAVFIAASSARLPFKDASVDVIYSNGTFHHMAHSHHATVLRELWWVLKAGGNAFIFENNPYNALMMYAMSRIPFDRDARVLRPGYLRRAMTDAGFDHLATHFYLYYPRALSVLRSTERYLQRGPLGAQYLVLTTDRMVLPESGA
jgi:ubiquinone/menaquinone biosynthesis C-methylase UbiE